METFEVKNSKTFTATVKVGISFVRGSFKFDFTLLEQNAPTHCKFQALGKGAGVSVQLTTAVDLKEIDANLTELSWTTDAVLGGLLNEISESLIQSSTSKFTRDFFECIRNKLESATLG